MSDQDETTDEPIIAQDAPDDTSNWDDKVSTDPSGDTYIKDIGDQEQTK
jgi:hypothetical protein